MNEQPTPLIWTSHGNQPLARLQHVVEWQVTPGQIIFVESYLLDGEVVKRSSHVHVLAGATALGEAST